MLGRLLAAGLAYVLFVQAFMISIGLGMSGGAEAGGKFVICSAANATLTAPPAYDKSKRPSPHPHCPFCFVAAQSAGQTATVGQFAGLTHVTFDSRDATYRGFVDRMFKLPLPHRTCDPRGPPQFSV